jgi:hypothetical protein
MGVFYKRIVEIANAEDIDKVISLKWHEKNRRRHRQLSCHGDNP